MQIVSSTFDAYPDERRVDCTVTFGVVAPDAAETAQPTSSTGATVSQLPQTHNGQSKTTAKYLTLEPDLYELDGSFELLPDDTTGVEIGFWSDVLSGADGAFASYPYVRYDFAANQKSYGFTLAFDSNLPSEYPSEIEVTTYSDASTVIETKTFYPDGWRYIVDMPTTAYKAVKVVFKKTNHPYRRVRLCEMTFGIIYEYDRTSISDVKYVHEIDPMAQALPAAELTATVDNTNKLYNMANPTGVYAYLQDGQTLDAAISIGGERVNMGKTYFTTAKSTDGAMTATITANDRMLLLDGFEYNSGVTGTWTLSDAVTAILAAANVSCAVIVPSDCNVTIRKCIPQKTKCREALRMAAQAARCTCYFDRLDRLVFVRAVAATTAHDELTRDRMEDEAQIEISNTYNTVKLTVRDEYADTETVYTASDIGADDYERADEIANPLVNDGQAVADWLLSGYKNRLRYKVQSRGNPALESGDTVKIHDYYGVNNNALVTGQEFAFDGGLECEVTAVG